MQPIIWQAVKWTATEYFILHDHGQGMVANGSINGATTGHPFCIHYQIEMTADWRVSSFHIRQESLTLTELKLTSDLHGYGGQGIKSDVREVLSRTKAVVDLLRGAPVTGGEPVPITGPARASWGPKAPPGTPPAGSP